MTVMMRGKYTFTLEQTEAVKQVFDKCEYFHERKFKLKRGTGCDHCKKWYPIFYEICHDLHDWVCQKYCDNPAQDSGVLFDKQKRESKACFQKVAMNEQLYVRLRR